MMKTNKILEFLGMTDEELEDESGEEIDNRQLFEAEIAEIMSEMAVVHSDTKEFASSAQSLKTVTEAYRYYEQAVTEKEKVISEKHENDRQWKIKLIDIAPRIVGLACSAGLTALWFMVEQQHPTANRLVNKTNDLLVRP